MSNNPNHNPRQMDAMPNIHAEGNPENTGKQALHNQLCKFLDMKAYLDGELSAPRRWIARAHLTRCEACREEILGLKRVSEEIKNLPQATPRPELRRRILASLPETPPQHASRTSSRLTKILHIFHPANRGMNLVWPGRLALSGSGLALLLLTALALNGHRLFHPVTNATIHTPQIDPMTAKSAEIAGDIRSPQDQSSGEQNKKTLVRIDNVPNPPDPIEDPSIYTDKTSREAAELANKQEAQVRKQEEAQHRQRERRQIAEARRHIPADSFNDSLPKAALTLTVPNITVAVNHLNEVAQHLGGAVAFVHENPGHMPYQIPSADTAATEPEPHRETTTSYLGNIGEVVVLIRVPAARTADLESSLRQTGNLEKLPLLKTFKTSPLPPSETSVVNAHGLKTHSNGEPLVVGKHVRIGDENPQASQQFITYEVRLSTTEHSK